MKILSAALLSLLAALTAQAAVTVSTTTGHVYDVGKGYYSSDENVTDKSDKELCWAAAAANLIQHWQDYYYKQHDTGETPPDGLNDNNYTSPTGTQYLAVFDAFRNNWEDAPGLASNGFQWWFLGKDKVAADASGNLEENADSAGYYQGIFTGTTTCYVQQDLLSAADREGHPQEECFRQTMDAALGNAGQGVSLGIYIADEKGKISSGHAITCWGYETDADGKLSAIYVTDSDDRYYGATKVRVEVDADGSLMLNSYDLASYNFNRDAGYFIGLMEYIDTPESIAQQSADLPSSITNGVVSSNTRLTEAYSGTGLSVAKEVIFSSTVGSSTTDGSTEVSITLTAPAEGNTGAGFIVEAGGMASLNDLTTLSAIGFAGAGMELKGYTYVTGATDVKAEDNEDCGIFNTAYLELLNCTAVSVTGNSQTDDNPDNEVLGGGIANHRTLSMIDCGTVTLSDNTATGAISAGGGMLSLAAVVEKNEEVIVTKNTVNGTELALGGGLYHFYINSISNNESVTITENAVSVQESAAEDEDLILQAIGGGLVQGAYSTDDPQTVLEENGTLTISNNTATATGTGGSKDSEIDALGGGLAVLSSKNHPSVVSIIGNTSVEINNNTVTATAEQGDALAFGGGAFVGSNSSLIIQGSEEHPQSVEIANNTASATYSGGGAIYSKGKVDISGNTSVSITGNQANGGSAVYNAGDFSLSGNGAVKVSGNQSGGNGAVYNGKDSTMEITWNDSVTFSENTFKVSFSEGAIISGSDFDIVNSGNLYLAADEGKNITLGSSGLYSAGTTYLGCDTEGKTGAGTLVVQKSDTVTSVFTPAQVAGSSKLVYCSVSYNSITALADAEDALAPTAQGMTVTYSGTDAYSIKGMALQDFAYVAEGGADLALTDTQVGSSCSFSVGSGTITLNNVEVLWTIPEGYTTGLTYTLDLSTLFHCTVVGDLSITLPGANTDDLFNAGYRYININFGGADVSSLNSVSVNNLKIVSGSGSTSVYYIPEPATSLLTLLALALPALRRRRR